MIGNEFAIFVNKGCGSSGKVPENWHPIRAPRSADEPQVPAITLEAVNSHHLHVCQASIPVIRDGVVGISGIYRHRLPSFVDADRVGVFNITRNRYGQSVLTVGTLLRGL